MNGNYMLVVSVKAVGYGKYSAERRIDESALLSKAAQECAKIKNSMEQAEKVSWQMFFTFG